jgi:enterochelin esterase-like enzyme
MGGRIATMTALAYADRFSAVGAFSPALRPDAEKAVQDVPAAAPFLYISCGTADSLLPINREFVGWLMERKLPHEYREAPGVGHTWALWDEDVRVFLDLLESRGFRAAP